MDDSGETPLTRAEKSGYRMLAEVLLRLERESEAPAEEAPRSLHAAAYWGLSEAAARLLEAGADPSEADYSGDTPLLEAVRNGHEETVEILLENGADVDASNEIGLTALHWTAFNGRADIAQTLLAQGANVNARAEKVGGLTPRGVAVLMGYDEIVHLVGSHGGTC
jgi:ankyrin repeat protein